MNDPRNFGSFVVRTLGEDPPPGYSRSTPAPRPMKGKQLTPTQSAVLDIIGRRFVFYWPGDGGHYCISHRDDGFQHGHYDRGRESAIARRKGTVATIRALLDKGALVRETWFRADACGNKAYILKPATRP